MIDPNSPSSEGLVYQPPLIPRYHDGLYRALLWSDDGRAATITMLVKNGITYEVLDEHARLILINEDAVTDVCHFKGELPCTNSKNESKSADSTCGSKPTPPKSCVPKSPESAPAQPQTFQQQMKMKSTTAATDATSKATTIKVKPLEWTGTVSRSRIVAETPIGNYCISIGEASSLSKPFELCDPWDRVKYFSSIEDAKQAALVWYNEKIVECLE